MDVKYVTPVIEAVRSVFATMIHLEVTLGKPYLALARPKYEISGVIQLSGDVVGCIALSLPSTVACTVIQNFAHREIAVGTPDFSDALGEIVNMISGAAKARFEGKKVRISTPSVVVGRGHTVVRPEGSICISLPCLLSCGEFIVDIAVREEPQPAKVAA